MGMQFNPMYQPTSTKTITVDGDLNLNPYDVLAVDGKFDTVKADEFVGGVGNFSSLTSAGNIVLNGDTDVKGLLHAEENLQVDGSLLLEGSINNVNIADDGTITTSKSVTATGGFKGNVTGNVTGSISGGTVAGSTGTFSGAVTGASFNNFNPYKTLYITNAPSTSVASNYILPSLSMGKNSGQSFIIMGTNTSQRTYIGNNNLLLNTSNSEFGDNTGMITKIITNVNGLTYKLIVSASSQVTSTFTISGAISKTVSINNTYSGEITLSASEVSNMLANPTYVKSSSIVYANVYVQVIVPSYCVFYI